MISHLRLASVYVRDQQRAADFYVYRLGFERRQDVQYGPNLHWVEVAPPGARSGLALLSPMVPGQHEELIGRPTGLVFSCDDVRSTWFDLEASGVKPEPLAGAPWGVWNARFSDPDGNSFLLDQIQRSPDGP
ncbi:MAG: VOC family protein [Acidimicrobiia bacterium]